MEIDQKLSEEKNTEEATRTKGKRGRPPFKINWPQSEFTADEVYRALNEKLSKVSIHSKIKNAVESGELVSVGKIQPKTGRPKLTYKIRVN